MTRDEAVAFVRECVRSVGGFHPDTPFADYVAVGSGEPTFTPERATELDAKIDAAFDVLGDDIYKVGLLAGNPLAAIVDRVEELRSSDSASDQCLADLLEGLVESGVGIETTVTVLREAAETLKAIADEAGGGRC